MTCHHALNVLLFGGVAVLLAIVFALYRTPLLEFYLLSWGLC